MLFTIALAAAEAAVILAIVVVAYRLHRDVDVSEAQIVRGIITCPNWDLSLTF